MMAKKVCVYGISAAVCLVLSYIESLFSLSFIAPGVKLGLSNAVALLFVSKGDIKGAFCVNTVRILISNLLFSSPFSLLFSLSAGLGSVAVTAAVSRCKKISIIGLGIAGGTVHNIIQAAVAALVMGSGVLYYLPVLILCGAASGLAVGIISSAIFKKMKTNNKF